ncbi:TIGR01244 family sulfur transferase [Aestuariivirga litoralis]|uniref:TIGR01244 family sulfur transferase n=1 Tax=Aestuariivirga litoralis TaxID=2650924 RepID=UPI0018C479DE|nr:TIGR01244 family sulfur transferase [Aestuariivirga litoralis]MBG1232654.1 TIGR01244 family phosphatase [Aestuariivirga litoralis]
MQTLSQDFSISAQIQPEEVALIARAGFKSIICNRPDGESFDQPDFALIEQAATDVGVQTRYIPIIPGQTNPEDITAFAQAMRDMPKPILAYCRSGARCNMIWQLSRG